MTQGTLEAKLGPVVRLFPAISNSGTAEAGDSGGLAPSHFSRYSVEITTF